MENHGHAVLCVDDESNILSSLRRLLRREAYSLYTATGGRQGLKILSETEVHVVISDQRMPEMSGVDFLAQVKELHPHAIRIILSGYTDVTSITEAINKGHIYKFLLKPWNDQNLILEIRQALQQHDLIKDNRRLHEQVCMQNVKLKEINEHLEDKIAERTRELEFKNRALELSHAILEDVPIPILGIGAEGTIAFINRRTQELSRTGFPVNLGDNAFEMFPADLTAMLEQVLNRCESARLAGFSFGGATYDLEIHPLSGRFNRKGVIVALNPAGR